MFFKHQTIENINKSRKPKNVAQHRVNFSPNPPTILGENQGGEMHGNHEDDESSQNVDSSVEPDESIEQEQPVEPVEQEELVLPQVRISKRERRPSQRYQPHEYVLLTDEGESETHEEAISCDKKSD